MNDQPAELVPSSKAAAVRVGVVIASVGRPMECADVLRRLLDQSCAPVRIVLSVSAESDLPAAVPDGVQVVMGPKGLCAQRNRGVAALCDACDVIAFFDDDYIPSRFAVAGLAALFERAPDVVGATGLVLADGVGRGGVSLAEAEAIVEAYDQTPPPPPRIEADVASAYGCNMAFRVSAMRKVAFDERLPLYGWQEDVDYAGQIRAFGRMVRTQAFAGVHRGVIGGRTPGAKLGFSQIVNPLYLARKGTMRWSHALRIMAGNIAANHLKLLTPEPHIDRAGRAKGNWIAVGHMLKGRLDPQAMLEIEG